MGHSAAARNAAPDSGVGHYQRHRPEQTLLYRIVEEYYPAFATHVVAQDRELPGYVQREFEDYLKCGRLEHGFLRVRCDTCHAEHLVPFSCKRRGFCPSCGALRMADDCMDAGGRATQGAVADDCMDAGGRATQGAVAENSYLVSDAVDDDPLNQLLGSSITYRIAVGPQAGRKVFA